MLEVLAAAGILVVFFVAFGLSILFDARSEQQYYQQQRDRCPVCSGVGTVLVEVGPPTYDWCVTHFSRWYSIKRLEVEMDRHREPPQT